MRRHSKTCAIVSVAFLLLAAAAFGQVDQGRIGGTVKDSTGAVIPGVSVTVKSEKTAEERESITDGAGQFAVVGIKPSVYTVRAELAGFTTAEVTGLQLVVGQKLNVELTLKPGAITESVTVETAAAAAVETSSASMGVNVDVREVGSLPINGRQLSQLYLQAPGAQNTGNGSFGDIRFNAKSTEQNAIRYDGIEGSGIVDAEPGVVGAELVSPFRLQSSLENVQEFRVESNNYPAEFGTGTGGQVSIVTKSGGNAFHGSLFEYLRNDKFDARNFFDREIYGLKKNPLRMNQFGGSLGGPIVKDKVFFFGSYEGYRLRNTVNIIEAAPSASAKAQAVALGSATASVFDAFHASNAVIIPGASADPNFDYYQLLAPNVVNENAGSFRLDAKVTDKQSMYFRFFRDQEYNVQPQSVSGRTLAIRAWPQNGVLSLQSIISTKVVNEAKIGFNEALTRGLGTGPIVNGIDTSFFTINVTGSASNTGIPGQGSSTGIAQAGGLVRLNSQANGRGAPYTPWTVSYIDNLSWVTGQHSFKFGGEVRTVRFYTDRKGGTQYTFNNMADFIANRVGSYRYVGDLSDPSVFNNGVTGNRKGAQEYYIGYAQDEWRLASSVTLNYGLRYEYYSPLRETQNHDVQFDIINGGFLPADQPFYKSSKNNFGPRLGLSYSPKSTTSIRGGFGIFFGPGQTEDLLQPIESDLINTVVSGGTFPIDTNAVRANFITNANNRQFAPRAYSPDYQVPEKNYQYSLSFQQELPGRFLATAAYVGSEGRNLFLRSIANRIVSVDPSTNVVTREFDIPVAGSTTPLKPYAEIDYKTSGGHDSYNALQLSLIRRAGKGLTMNSQYTLGRSRGNSQGSNEAVTASNNARALNDFDFDEGYNNFDIRHNFNTSVVYTLPVGKGRSFMNSAGSLADAVLGGWEIGGIANARSGLPINVLITRPDTIFVDAAGTVYTTAGAGRTAVINTPGGGSTRATRRPDVIPGVPLYLDNDRSLLNPAAFTVPKPGTFGNFPRNGARGPNFRQIDAVVSKKFAITETSSIDFRAEIFNMFNFTNFAVPPATLTPASDSTGKLTNQPGQPFPTSTFGVMTSTVERSVGLGTNRQIQFALRYTF